MNADSTCKSILRYAIGLMYLMAMLTGCRATLQQQTAKKLGVTAEQIKVLERNSGISVSRLLKTDRSQLPEMFLEARHPDMPRYREAFWAQLHRDEKGAIPPDALRQAVRQKTAILQRIARTRMAVAGLPIRSSLIIPHTAGLNPAHTGWTELGPAGVGGRSRAIAIDPKNPQRMWVASIGGGVWKSNDGANTFAPVDDLMANLVISSLVIDPTNPDVVYAGTGEGFYNGDALRGAGIFATTDGSKWSQVVGTSGPGFYWVNRLAISPDGKILVAATRQGLMVSSDAKRSDWNLRLAGNMADVKFHPTDSKEAVAGGLNTGQAYYSDDGGGTWHTAAHGPTNWIRVAEDGTTSPSRVEVTYAKANPKTVYASVDNNYGEIWRSNDGGQSYSKMGTLTADGLAANYLGGQGWYGNAIWAGDPTNADFVVLGGINLWKSTDGGKTLVDISDWRQDQSPHADHHIIVSAAGYNGSSNKTAYFGNDGGIFIAQDISTVGSDDKRIDGWTKINHNYAVTQFYGIAIAADGSLVAGAQDNGTLALSSGGKPDGWSELFGGDGGFCAADPSDATYVYGEYVQGNIHRRAQAGAIAEYISGQYYDYPNQQWAWKAAPYQISDAKAGNANFIAPFVLDPNDSNRILVGGASLWETRDAKTPNTVVAGPQWRPIKAAASAYISAIAVVKGNSNLIWVGHNDGTVYTTTNGLIGTPQWTPSGVGALPSRMVTHITVDPKNANTVYIAFGGFSTGNIWKTIDGGVHWNASGTQTSVPVFTLAVHPKNSKYLYAGTETGIFASEDGGAHWSPGNQGPTNCAVFDLQWSGNTLYAASHGRGAFRIDLTSVPPGT